MKRTGWLAVLAIVTAILCVFVASSTTMAATNSDCDQLIALPAAHQLMGYQTQLVAMSSLSVKTTSPPSHDSQTSVMVALLVYNTYGSVRTDKLLARPLRC